MSLDWGVTTWLCAAASVGKHPQLVKGAGSPDPANNPLPSPVNCGKYASCHVQDVRTLLMAQVELSLDLSCRGYAETQGGIARCPMYARVIETGYATIPDDWTANTFGYGAYWAARRGLSVYANLDEEAEQLKWRKVHVASLTYHRVDGPDWGRGNWG